MSAANGNGTWKKILGALLIPMAAGLIGYGSLKEQVRGVQAQVETKASRETVDAQYQSILRELQALRAEVQQLRRP